MAPEQIGRLTYEHVNCAVVVAHPDDETLWAGGTMLLHPDSCWTVVTLTRKSDPNRAPRFFKALERYNARGVMGDLDDGPEQKPLGPIDVQDAIMDLLPSDRLDLLLTHGPWGEYTSHKRHEEVSRAIRTLRQSERLRVGEIWMFAYDDKGGKRLPQPLIDADTYVRLPQEVWKEKYRLITEVYGFATDSFEARTTPKDESFWVMGKTK